MPSRVARARCAAVVPRVMPAIDREFPEEGQLRLSRELALAFGYDLVHGRIDKAVHPFSSGSGLDVRITTRTNPRDPFNCFYSTIHEVGHAASPPLSGDVDGLAGGSAVPDGLTGRYPVHLGDELPGHLGGPRGVEVPESNGPQPSVSTDESRRHGGVGGLAQERPPAFLLQLLPPFRI